MSPFPKPPSAEMQARARGVKSRRPRRDVRVELEARLAVKLGSCGYETKITALTNDSGVEVRPMQPSAPDAVRQEPADLNLAEVHQCLPGWSPVPGARPAERPHPATPALPPQPWRRRERRQVKLALIAATAVILAAGVNGCVERPQSPESQTQTAAQPTPPPSAPTGQPAPASGQIVLPFTALEKPMNLAVDFLGNLYVADYAGNRVVKLPPGADTPVVLPVAGLKLNHPWGVAVNRTGDLYVGDYAGAVADANNERVLKLVVGSPAWVELPFTGLIHPWSVAVDSADDVYVGDYAGNEVLKLAAGSDTPTALPLAGVGVAVDGAGNVYVSDSRNRVLKLAAGSDTPDVLPFTGLNGPIGVAVDAAGSVYVADQYNSRVVKLAANSATQVVLPFTGLNGPTGVAVDATGSVYVADQYNSRVLKLPATAPTTLPPSATAAPR